MPSWSPSGVTSTRTQHRLPRASALTVSHRAHLQRDYTALGKTEHATAADDLPATASGAADQAPDERSAPGSGTRVEAGSNTDSQPTNQPPGTIPSWGRGHLD